MAIAQKRAKRKITGGRYKKTTKRLHALASVPTQTKLEDTRKKVKRVRSAHLKHILLSANKVNVLDPKTKKNKVVLIKTVLENPANRHFVRRNIITKGTIVDTELGKARITSRPAQHGVLNGVLI